MTIKYLLLAGCLSSTLCLLLGCADSRPYTEESIIAAQRAHQASVPPSSSGPVSTPAQAAPPEPPPVVQEKPYTGLYGNHWINAILGDGERFKLDDGSLWQVTTGDRVKTRNWIIAAKISVTRGSRSDFAYRLTNTDKNESADARLISQ